jgi:hypothetical protein
LASARTTANGVLGQPKAPPAEPPDLTVTLAAHLEVTDRAGAKHPWSPRRSEDFRPFLAVPAASTLKL